MRKILLFSCVLCLLTFAACNLTRPLSPTPAPFTSQLITAVPSTPTITPSPTTLATATAVPSVTPSTIPTHSLERLKDKLPSATPVYGFVVLEMPQTVYWDDMITVTILTAPGTDCLIWYFGTSGVSHAKGLEPQIADANGICSWTWKQATILGKTEGSLPLTAKISIIAGGTWGDYYLVVQ